MRRAWRNFDRNMIGSRLRSRWMEASMKLLLSFLMVLLPLQGFASAEASPATTADRAQAVEGNTAFALALYGRLRTQPGNLFFSPESISTALAMTYAGARGDTAAEMAKTLHFTLPPDRLHPAMGALLNGLNAPHDAYHLNVANALWAGQDYKFRDDFLKLTASNYGAGFHPVDFKGAAEAARLTINQWVEEKTANKINDLLQPGTVTPLTRMVLTDAIYFKADWQAQFQKAQTEDENFYLSTERKNVKAPLMHRSGGYSYFDGGTFQVLELPYKSGEMSMIVFLPRDMDGLPAFEQSLTAPALQQYLGRLQLVPKVIVTFPRFKVTEQLELGSTLGAMGMPKAFDRNAADFSGMTGNRELSLSAVIHKAFIDVNETGTEAAAATAAVMVGMAMRAPDPTPPPEFRADHPFLYLIRDNRSGGILFMGRVSDPTK
jgi:serpin B